MKMGLLNREDVQRTKCVSLYQLGGRVTGFTVPGTRGVLFKEVRAGMPLTATVPEDSVNQWVTWD